MWGVTNILSFPRLTTPRYSPGNSTSQTASNHVARCKLEVCISFVPSYISSAPRNLRHPIALILDALEKPYLRGQRHFQSNKIWSVFTSHSSCDFNFQRSRQGANHNRVEALLHNKSKSVVAFLLPPPILPPLLPTHNILWETTTLVSPTSNNKLKTINWSLWSRSQELFIVQRLNFHRLLHLCLVSQNSQASSSTQPRRSFFLDLRRHTLESSFNNKHCLITSTFSVQYR